MGSIPTGENRYKCSRPVDVLAAVQHAKVATEFHGENVDNEKDRNNYHRAQV